MKRTITVDMEKIKICKISPSYHVEVDVTKILKTRKKATNAKNVELNERCQKC